MKKKILLKALKGLNRKTAEILLKGTFTKYRIVREDNMRSCLTMDYCCDRINMIVEKNRVIEAYLG